MKISYFNKGIQCFPNGIPQDQFSFVDRSKWDFCYKKLSWRTALLQAQVFPRIHLTYKLTIKRNIRVAQLPFAPLLILFVLVGCDFFAAKTTQETEAETETCKYLGRDIALYDAISAKNTVALQKAIDKGTEINACGFSSEHSTPLMFAAANSGMRDILDILLRAGAAVDQLDAKGRTALFHATDSTNALEHIEILLKAGASIDLQDHKGMTALSFAIYGRKPDVVNYLMGKQGMSLVPGDVLRASNLSTLQMVLSYGGNINERDTEGLTPLLMAAKYYDYDRVKFLIEKGVDVLQEDLNGNNILTINNKFFIGTDEGAAMSNFRFNYAFWDFRKNLGYAYSIAAAEKFFNYILSIDELNVIASDIDLFQVTDLSLMKDLIDNKGFNAKVIGIDWGNLLFAASRKADLDMAKYLLTKGLDPTIKGRSQQTIFHEIRVDPTRSNDEQIILNYMKYFYTLPAAQQLSAAELSIYRFYSEIDPRSSESLSRIYSLLDYFEFYRYNDVLDYLKNDLKVKDSNFS